MRRTGKAFGTLAAATSLSLLGGGLALADDVTNTLDQRPGSQLETMNLEAGGAAGTTEVTVVARNGDSFNGCNIPSGGSLTVNLNSSDTTKATVSPARITFTGCGAPETVTVTPVAHGSSTISLTFHASQGTSGSFNYQPASFTASVAAAAAPAQPACPTPSLPQFTTAGSDMWRTAAPSANATTQSGVVHYATGTPAGAFSTTVPTITDGDTTVSAKSVSSGSSCTTVESNVVTARYLVDTVAPSVTPSSVTSTTWRNTPLAQVFSASDIAPGSGLALAADETFTLTASADSTRNSSGTAIPTVVSRTVADVAGNTTPRSVSALIDTAAPTVTCPSPAPIFQLNASSVVLTAGLSDALSGVAANTTTATPDVSALGAGQTVSVTGSDIAGNPRSVNCSYSVVPVFKATNTAIDGSGLTKAKAGSSVPLKFQITDANGVGLAGFTAVATSLQSLSCAAVGSADAAAEATAGNSGLQDLGDGHYQLNWKTLSTHANSCRTLTVDVAGATQSANFQFVK